MSIDSVLDSFRDASTLPKKKFWVLDNMTGMEVNPLTLSRLVADSDWGKGMLFDDLVGFAVTDTGILILCDELGQYCLVPTDRFVYKEMPHEQLHT